MVRELPPSKRTQSLSSLESDMEFLFPWRYKSLVDVCSALLLVVHSPTILMMLSSLRSGCFVLTLNSTFVLCRTSSGALAPPIPHLFNVFESTTKNQIPAHSGWPIRAAVHCRSLRKKRHCQLHSHSFLFSAGLGNHSSPLWSVPSLQTLLRSNLTVTDDQDATPPSWAEQ
ncbi:hypothetical protein EDB87DRAFT_808972 [Lactarius vividus]|nr:hypothetical protein EDB87DRAFT_808972 [Lactarius vividus]